TWDEKATDPRKVCEDALFYGGSMRTVREVALGRLPWEPLAMAAWGGGASPPNLLVADGVGPQPRSFAQALVSSLLPTIPVVSVHPPTRTDNGEPAVFFTAEEVSAMESEEEDIERCSRRPGLRPRVVLRCTRSWDRSSLEF
ncbi:hypothetical protein Taro_047617, partial [Colocasia esculenta]|nr:hypothetical protein [Colocasia esculenta]